LEGRLTRLFCNVGVFAVPANTTTTVCCVDTSPARLLPKQPGVFFAPMKNDRARKDVLKSRSEKTFREDVQRRQGQGHGPQRPWLDRAVTASTLAAT